MTIEVNDLRGLIVDAVDLGIQRYRSTISPAEDNIKQSDAVRYIVREGFPTGQLRKWVENGQLTPIKTGEAKNSSVYYSLSEIKTLILALRHTTI